LAGFGTIIIGTLELKMFGRIKEDSDSDSIDRISEVDPNSTLTELMQKRA